MSIVLKDFRDMPYLEITINVLAADLTTKSALFKSNENHKSWFFIFISIILNKYKISTMAISKEESIIIAKIGAIVKKIQGFLVEIGCSQKQIAAYFGQKIFASKASLK